MEVLSNKWFPLGIKTDNRKKMFCFAHAGGTANVFRAWTQFENDKIQVIPVELPGRATRLSEPIVNRVDRIAEEIADDMQNIVSNGEYILYGHSLGALIAFQTAFYMEHCYGKQASVVIVSGRHAPFREETCEFRSWMGVESLIEEMRRIETVQEELLMNREFIDFFAPIILNDYFMNENYVYNNEKISAPILGFSSIADIGAEPSEMKYWEHVTLSKFQLIEMKGTHFFVYNMGKEFFLKMMDKIAEILEK